MVVTEKVNLPTEKELSVSEVNLSTSFLLAGAFHLGKTCEQENNEFMLCKEELRDPRKCLAEGKSVTNCALNFFHAVKNACHEEFIKYATCLNRSTSDMRFSACRTTQNAFDECAYNRLGIERPHYGYFCCIKVHKTEREKPEDTKVVYSDTPASRPTTDFDHPPANLDSRFVV